MSVKARLLLDYAVHFDAGIGAYQRARAARYALVRLFHIRVMVAAVVDLFGLQAEDVGGTCDHAKLTAFATVDVHRDCSNNFCHNR